MTFKSVDTSAPEPEALTSGFPAQANLATPLIDNRAWPVPDQERRNTCAAFCASAMAELTDFHATGANTVVNYSEEFLYSAISRVPYREAVQDVSRKDIKRFQSQGVRFLAQAKIALQAGALVPDDAMAYDPDLAIHKVKDIPPAVQEIAALQMRPTATNKKVRKVNDELFVGQGRPWAASKDSDVEHVDVVPEFVKLLAENKAIAAGFPLLSGGNYDIWFDDDVVKTGRIRYPSATKLADMPIEGGHSVCIVGYDTENAEPGGGVFIFRNSFADRFGWRPKKFSDAPALPKGYGYISFYDVDVFCMEFLHL
ncbi:MAG: C1 family peptidase [Pseudomonadota bacterium]